MEHEPKRSRLTVEINGVEFELTPENSEAWVHENMSEYDHLVFDGNGQVYRVYRRVLDNFDEIVEYMIENDYAVVGEVYPDQKDIDAYHKVYGYPEIKLKELTPRQERKILFARYLLDHEFIIPDNFRERL